MRREIVGVQVDVKDFMVIETDENLFFKTLDEVSNHLSDGDYDVLLAPTTIRKMKQWLDDNKTNLRRFSIVDTVGWYNLRRDSEKGIMRNDYFYVNASFFEYNGHQ